MSWSSGGRRAAVRREPAPVGAWDVAVRRARDAWRDLGGDPPGSEEPGHAAARAAAILSAAVGLMPWVVAELRDGERHTAGRP